MDELLKITAKALAAQEQGHVDELVDAMVRLTNVVMRLQRMADEYERKALACRVLAAAVQELSTNAISHWRTEFADVDIEL